MNSTRLAHKGEAFQEDELQIERMNSAECATRVEEQLTKLEGVSPVNVLLAAEKGIIVYGLPTERMGNADSAHRS